LKLFHVHILKQFTFFIIYVSTKSNITNINVPSIICNHTFSPPFIKIFKNVDTFEYLFCALFCDYTKTSVQDIQFFSIQCHRSKKFVRQGIYIGRMTNDCLVKDESPSRNECYLYCNQTLY
jgi:hypothetical protein